MRSIKKTVLRFAALSVAAALCLLLASYRPDLSASEIDARFVNAYSRFVTLANGSRIHVRDEGQLDGPVLVLLHGSYDSLHTWEAWVAQLRDRFRLVSLDLPGYGLTGPVPEDDYSDAAYVRTLHGVMEALGIHRFALAGISTGGAVAWQYTLEHPDRVTGLVLLAASGYPEDHLLPPFARSVAIRAFGVVSRWAPRWLVTKAAQYAVVNPSVISDQTIDRVMLMLRREGSGASAVRNLLIVEPNPAGRVNAIRAPTLILWGERDRLIPVENAYAFHRDIPGSQLIVYPNVGHGMTLEIPERSAADAAAFLFDNARRASTPGTAGASAAARGDRG